MRTYQKIRLSGDENAVERYESLHNEIEEIAGNFSIYSAQGTTDSNGRWSILLHKRSFHVDRLSNQIDTLKVRCQGRYLSLAYVQSTRTFLPDDWGDCSLEVIGAANADLELDQF
jgi:hypothetical protein